MKKHNISQFLKNKSFYVILSVGVLAIVVVSLVGLNTKSKSKGKNNLVDLNEPYDIAQNSENHSTAGKDNLLDHSSNTSDVSDKNSNNTNDASETKKYSNDDLLEYDNYQGTLVEEPDNQEVAKADSKATNQDTSKKTEVAATSTPEQSVSVMQPKGTADNLKFGSKSVISWPVKGNVIMNYSMDSLIHFATLGEWKCNPAIVISSKVGTNVVASTKGIVSKISEEKETGTTITTSVGNGYEIIYGQLENVTCKVGDIVNEGTVIGTIAKPTSYYTVEGSNLYLQVRQDEKTFNPMLFLSGEE